LRDIDHHKNTLGYFYGEIESNVKVYSSTKWAALISGSSKSDLVNFLCK